MRIVNSVRYVSPIIRSRCASSLQYHKIPNLPNGTIATFRQAAFLPSRPSILPLNHFKSIPAVKKWFKVEDKNCQKFTKLNAEYLSRYGAMIVPLELTSKVTREEEFARLERPLSEFLQFISHGDNNVAHLYLAQCPLSTLHQDLQNDLPTPSIVSEAGRGDIYDSSIWIGLAPTYTPLHKDPNPNLFVQLAGSKRVRIFEPQVGAEIFAEAQKRIGGMASASIRGDEMMRGAEKKVLEQLVWGAKELGGSAYPLGAEATLLPGDGMFIPKGWWHSIKGEGNGIVGSVNWWFR